MLARKEKPFPILRENSVSFLFGKKIRVFFDVGGRCENWSALIAIALFLNVCCHKKRPPSIHSSWVHGCLQDRRQQESLRHDGILAHCEGGLHTLMPFMLWHSRSNCVSESISYVHHIICGILKFSLRLIHESRRILGREREKETLLPWTFPMRLSSREISCMSGYLFSDVRLRQNGEGDRWYPWSIHPSIPAKWSTKQDDHAEKIKVPSLTSMDQSGSAIQLANLEIEYTKKDEKLSIKKRYTKFTLRASGMLPWEC